MVDDSQEATGIKRLFCGKESSAVRMWPDFASGSRGLGVVEFADILVAIEVKITIQAPRFWQTTHEC